MRVLHITSGLGAGGAERSLLQLVRACDSVSLAASDAGLGDPSEANLMRVASLTSAADLAPQFASPPAVFDVKTGLFAALNDLMAYARDYAPDVIQGWMYHGNLVASYIGWRLGVPVIWSIRHSLEQPKAEAPGLKLVIRLGRMACYEPKRVVYNSYSGWSTHASFGYGKKPSMIIPNGVDINYFSSYLHSATASTPSSGAFARTPSVPVLGCVARFHPMKGIATLLTAHAAMQSELPCELMLAGSGMTDDNADLSALIARVGCPERVTRLGLVDAVASVYTQFSALVLPSLFGEGTPNVLLEAMASSVPVVATRVGDAPRCIGADEWLVAPGDSAALREKLLAVLNLDAAEREALIDSNLQHLRSNYSLDVCHDRYRALYNEVHTNFSAPTSFGATP